jgi:flagellin
MISINTDMPAIKAQLAHRKSSVGMYEAAEKLASGKRFNTARDDEAGLYVSSKMGAEFLGQKVVIKAASDAALLLLVQETAVEQSSDIAMRIHELAVQMANSLYADSDRAFVQLEVDQLIEQSTMVSSEVRFNGVNIANGTTGITPDLRIQAGAGVDDTFAVAIVSGATLSAMLSTESDVTSQANAQQTMTAMVSTLATMSEQKATIGASINRLKATIDNLSAS